MTDQCQAIPVHVGGQQVGWKDSDTGAYTPAVRVELPGQPVGSCKPLSKHWSE